MVAKASDSQMCPAISTPMQEKGSRNKRKFHADPPVNNDPNKVLSTASPQAECPAYEFSAEKFEVNLNHVLTTACESCGVCQGHYLSKHDRELSSALQSSDMGTTWPKEEVEVDEFHDADWSDLTETQLEELVLRNLDAIFKSAIKKIVSFGYSEEVATKAVLRSAHCYGKKDIVSNIVDHTFAYLMNGQELDSSRLHCFEDLQQLEKYILVELITLMRAVRPLFSDGDAMWWLLICDMNISHACVMDSDPLSSFFSDGTPNVSSSTTQSPPKTESITTDISVPNSCKPNQTNPCNHGSQLEKDKLVEVSSFTKPKNAHLLSGLASDKESSTPALISMDRPFSATGTSQTPALEEKFISSRKIHSSSSKRESTLRQKSLRLEKSYRTYGSKGTSRAGKLSGFGGLFFDKKLKCMSDPASSHFKHCSVKISKATGVDVPPESVGLALSANSLLSSSTSFSTAASPSLSLDSINDMASLQKLNNLTANPVISSSAVIPPADTSLPLATKSNPSSLSVGCDHKTSSSQIAGLLLDKSLIQWPLQEKKGEMVMKLVPRVRELQNQLQDWTEWANQKVMQAARRLSKDKAELKTLRQEKEEVERLKKEKQTLEKNTMKKISEMKNALSKASGQVERTNSTVCRLEVEKAALRQEMEAAKLQAVESAASCEEVIKREKKTLVKFQSWEKQKALLQEELAVERHKLSQLQKELEQAEDLQLQLEDRSKLEEKAKKELLTQANLIRKEREQRESSAKTKEEMIKSKAVSDLQKFKDDIQKLEKEISHLRLKTDSSKIAALRRGIDGSYASKLTDIKIVASVKESHTPYLLRAETEFVDCSGTVRVRRERECVMCLSEEMSVVFLPCAHQVVCAMCNELHEKQGMKDCPSCRTPIQRRIPVLYARP